VIYKPPTYGDYEYPAFVEIIGWILAVVPILPIVVVACKVLISSPGKTITEVKQNSFVFLQQSKSVEKKNLNMCFCQ